MTGHVVTFSVRVVLNLVWFTGLIGFGWILVSDPGGWVGASGAVAFAGACMATDYADWWLSGGIGGRFNA